MSEFCKCGSIMINGSCTNKSCSNKLLNVAPAKKRTPSAAKASTKTSAVKTERKTTKVPRASKCITYSINDLIQKEES